MNHHSFQRKILWNLFQNSHSYPLDGLIPWNFPRCRPQWCHPGERDAIVCGVLAEPGGDPAVGRNGRNTLGIRGFDLAFPTIFGWIFMDFEWIFLPFQGFFWVLWMSRVRFHGNFGLGIQDGLFGWSKHQNQENSQGEFHWACRCGNCSCFGTLHEWTPTKHGFF